MTTEQQDDVDQLVEEAATADQSPADATPNGETEQYTLEDLLEELEEEEQYMIHGFIRRAKAAYELYKTAADTVQRSRDVGVSVADKWGNPGDDTEIGPMRKRYEELLEEADALEIKAKELLKERFSKDIDEKDVKAAEDTLKLQKAKYDNALQFANEDVLEPAGVKGHTLQEFVPALPKVSSVAALSGGGREGKKPRIGAAYVDGEEIVMEVKQANGQKTKTSNFTALRMWLAKETGKKVETAELQDAWLRSAHVDNYDKIEFPVEFVWPKKDGGFYNVRITPLAKKA
jgi:murein DD-endopeptidase MepM/ murein hydrolase activator NlpD